MAKYYYSIAVLYLDLIPASRLLPICGHLLPSYIVYLSIIDNLLLGGETFSSIIAIIAISRGVS